MDGGSTANPARRAAPAPRSQPEQSILRDLVPMRPQGAVEIVDRATHLLRTRARDLAVISLGVNLPVWLVLAIVLRERWAAGLTDNVQWFWSGLVPDPFLFLTSGADGSSWAFALGRALPSLGLAVTGAACGLLVQSWSQGRPLTGAAALACVARRGHRLLLLWAIVHAVEILTVVGVLVGPVAFGVAAPLWAMEGQGAWVTLRRSWTLARSELGRVLGTVATATFVAALVSAILGGATLAVLYGLIGEWTDLGGTASVSLVGVLPHLVLDPLLGLSMALLALDLQVRVDGADLRAEIAALRPVAR